MEGTLLELGIECALWQCAFNTDSNQGLASKRHEAANATIVLYCLPIFSSQGRK
jgi:hypothetical protein